MKHEIKFREGSVQEMGTRAEETPQARPVPSRAASNGIMPYILAGTLGLGGGGLGTSVLNPSVTSDQVREHITRLADKVEHIAQRLEDKISDLEDKLDDLENEINNERRERQNYRPLPEDDVERMGDARHGSGKGTYWGE